MFIVATNKDSIRKKLPGAISIHQEDEAKQNGTTVWIEAQGVRVIR